MTMFLEEILQLNKNENIYKKTKFKKSDDQPNIDKYRVSYYIKINLP